MSAFKHEKLSREVLVRRHASTTRVITDLFSEYKELTFEVNSTTTEPFEFSDLVNALVVLFTEAGVRLLFSNPLTRQELLQQAHTFLMLSFSDNSPRVFDDQTTIAIYCILSLYPIQNNRREARRKEVERFLTRQLNEAWSVEYVAYLHELLFAEDYLNSRYITFFRFPA